MICLQLFDRDQMIRQFVPYTLDFDQGSYAMLKQVIRVLEVPARLVPAVVHNEITARLFSHLVRGQEIRDSLRELNGRTIRVHITDMSMSLYFVFDEGRARRGDSHHWDVSISGMFEDFIALAARQEDPDTLFFNRRLCLEGDTEAGLYFKNLLDAFEFDWQAHVSDVTGRPVPGIVVDLVESGLRRTSAMRRNLEVRLKNLRHA